MHFILSYFKIKKFITFGLFLNNGVCIHSYKVLQKYKMVWGQFTLYTAFFLHKLVLTLLLLNLILIISSPFSLSVLVWANKMSLLSLVGLFGLLPVLWSLIFRLMNSTLILNNIFNFSSSNKSLGKNRRNRIHYCIVGLKRQTDACFPYLFNTYIITYHTPLRFRIII